jgi:hypothetical protein
MVDQASQRQPEQPKLSLAMTWADLTPEMQAYYAMTMFQSPELAKVLLEKSADPAFLAKIKAELAQTQVSEGTRATIERGRLDLSALQTAVEGRLAVKQMLMPAQAANGSPPTEGSLP